MSCLICGSEEADRCAVCYDWLRGALARALEESEKYREQLTALQTTFHRPQPRRAHEHEEPAWQRDLCQAMIAALEPALAGHHPGDCPPEAACCARCHDSLRTSLERALRACRNGEAAAADDVLRQFVEEETARRQAGDDAGSEQSRPGRYYRSHFADDL